MNLLFSADWHLGTTLGRQFRQERLPDQLRQLRRIADYAREREVDVLAVAGDVFEAQEKGAARAAAAAMMSTLQPAIERGTRLVAIAGNHDRDYFMETANVWLSAGGRNDDRIVLCTRPRLLTLEARGERVNMVLLPFPNPWRYEARVDDAASAVSRNELVAQIFIEEMERLRAEVAAMRLPTALLTHVTVEGTGVGPYKISARDDIVVPRAAFPAFELTVVGHIHKAEQIGSAPFYYVGALDRMDIGERDYEPRVLLADIGPDGVRSVESLPLDPTPIAEVVAGSEDDLHDAAARIERLAETLVKVRLQVPRGTYAAPLLDTARSVFPRLYDAAFEWADAPAASAKPAGDAPPLTSVRDTLHWYIQRHQLDGDERAALLALGDELLIAGGAP